MDLYQSYTYLSNYLCHILPHHERTHHHTMRAPEDLLYTTRYLLHHICLSYLAIEHEIEGNG